MQRAKARMRTRLTLLLVLLLPLTHARDFEATPTVAWRYRASGPIESAAALTEDRAFFATEAADIVRILDGR